MKTTEPIAMQTIQADWLQERNIKLDVLRLDKWHSVVSGNKWFKLQYYLQDAADNGYIKIATFGGAYSNHIVATAFACREMKLQSMGMIRGGKPPHLSYTLREAEEYRMKLHFASREDYKHKEDLKKLFPDAYWINEGGYGNLGAIGAADILSLVPELEIYTHIVCAVGTGTTIAGLIKKSLPHQMVIGISALKNNTSIADEVKHLLSEDDEQKRHIILHDYHFGGYAKYNPVLISYMNEIWQQHQLPLDFVYTAKAFYGLQNLIVQKQILPDNSRILFIHTGGLQGNISLGKESLSFL